MDFAVGQRPYGGRSALRLCANRAIYTSGNTAETILATGTNQLKSPGPAARVKFSIKDLPAGEAG
jgi:hypothetical protein